ncbi:hypothetical protein Tco_1077731 [Tanacetum coccineum]
MGTIDSMKSVLTQSALDALCERFHIPDVVHPELPGRNDRIRNSPVDILAYFQINLSQLSVIAAAKVFHFEILCRVYGFVPTIDLFSFINHADPTKVRIGERKVTKREVLLLQLTKGHIVPISGLNDQVNVDVEGAGNDGVNGEGSDATTADKTEKDDHVVQIEGIDIVLDDETQAIIADKPKRLRNNRKAANGASGSGLPPKKLREDHGVSGDADANTARKYLVVLQGLLDRSTLAAEI